MNFLAHFLLTDPGDSPEYQLGALLPDIAKRAKIVIKPGQLDSIDPKYSDFKKGIELHWKADRIFHNSRLFVYGMELWKRQLHKAVPQGISKTFFLYHLLFEMWLDRVLMKNKPEADKIMYGQLEKVDLLHLKEFSFGALGDENGQLLRAFNGFQTRRFVSHYRKPEPFAEIGVDVFNYVTSQKLLNNFENNIVLVLSELDSEKQEVLSLWQHLKSEIVS